MPTFQVCSTAPVLGSSATTVFCPLSAAYSVDPSGEYTIWPTSAELGVGVRPLPERWLPAVGSEKRTGVPRVPSEVTGNRVTASCSGSHRNWPSGEYVGPICPTVPSDRLWLTPGAEPTAQMSLFSDRSKICRTTDLSVLVAARNRPSGLTVEPMNLPSSVSSR